MQDAQDSIMGTAPSEQKPENQKPSDQKPEEPKEDEQEGSGQQQPNPDQETNTENQNPSQGGSPTINESMYFPGIGTTTLKELVDKGYIAQEFEDMYSRGDLTEEQYNAIKAYVAQLGNGNN